MKSRSFYKLPLYPHTIAHILTKLEAKYGFKHVSYTFLATDSGTHIAVYSYLRTFLFKP